RKLRFIQNDARVQISGSMRQHKVGKLGLRGASTRAKYHERYRDFALDIVWIRYDGSLCDIRMTLEELLDLSRVDILSAADEHFIRAPDEIKESRGIAAHDVTGVVPAVLELLRSLPGEIQIALHDGRTAYLEGSLFRRPAGDQAPFDAGQRTSQ